MTLRFPIPLVVAVLALLTTTSSAQAMLHPGVGRFLQREPLGYVEGMSL